MSKYNKLTIKLLAEGYTVDHFPRYVQISSSRLPGDDPLNNLYGGFEYKPWYADQIIYQTGCGKFIMGSFVLRHMIYMGIDWTHENDNPVFRCPFDNPDCQDNDSRLHGAHGGGLCIHCFCVCHKSDKPYDYENSIEKAERERREEKERKYKEYSFAHNGRICENHMFYNEKLKEWYMRYKPERCATNCYHRNGYCPVLGKKLNKKRGNVFYDIKTSGEYRQERQCSILDGKRWTNIRKAVRYFEKPCSMDICEAFIKMQSGEIGRKYEINNSMSRMMDPTWEFQISNIRAESRASRNLDQDLQDLRNGIDIVFEPDFEKEQKMKKQKKAEENKQKKIRKLERKLIEVGYENLEDFSLDKVHADKYLSKERILELEKMRQQRISKEKRKPVQMTIDEFYKGDKPKWGK